MHIDTFKKISRQISELEKSNIAFDVAIRGDSDWQKGTTSAFFEPIHFSVDSLKKLSTVQTILDRPIRLRDGTNKIEVKGLVPKQCVTPVLDIAAQIQKSPALKNTFPTLKFFSDHTRGRIGSGFVINMISETPTEQTEEGLTYRYIGDAHYCLFCIPHTHDLYNYLDRGFFYCHLNKNGKSKTVIANELTVDSFLVMLLAYLQPALTKHLQNECFINANTAKVTRIKFEKELKDFKDQYNQTKDLIMHDYEKTVNANLIQKLIEGKLPTASYNSIKLSLETANYEAVSLEAKNMLTDVQKVMVFDDRTDIYGLIRSYITSKIDEIEFVIFKEGENDEASRTFKINGIEMTIKRTTENTRRYINNVPINKAELEQVCFRASCFTEAEMFKKFIDSVHKMSLKYHDALANGIPMKIHDNLTGDEFRKAEAPAAAPRVKFKKDEKNYYLVIDDNKSAKIKFGDVIKKLATLNRRINDGYSYVNGYARRNATWGRSELAKTLKECCTFEEDELIVDKDKKAVLDDKGKKQYKVKTVCYLTDDDAKFIGEMAKKFHERAIEKSKIFLETAIKATGAVLQNFKGDECYIVQGKLHKYAVNKKTNMVSNYDTGHYICIVEPGHQVSVGCDATAARLYALKNDAVTVQQIGTLHHA